jgi:hypothetical protein
LVKQWLNDHEAAMDWDIDWKKAAFPAAIKMPQYDHLCTNFDHKMHYTGFGDAADYLLDSGLLEVSI